MTNWPNIQEYRNLETKFIDDHKCNGFTNSNVDCDLETVLKNKYKFKNNADDTMTNQKLQNSEAKIVRCVIRKDFEETFKKLDRVLNNESDRPKPPDPPADLSLNKTRLENHLKWKKQKEEEYQKKKEAEKIAQRKKKEEELRLERTRKQKEKEREQKMREWQEQKARDKEEKKKEKIVIKKLEEELKNTPTVEKERLIEEWIKLKDKQKQIEAEKKAQLIKKEEESKALRQNLAELSYRQWKERIKGRMITLPKNGYQIFGPKPIPVVKEDWNHDFITNSPRQQSYALRSTKSNMSMSLSFCQKMKDFEDISKEVFFTEEFKHRNSGVYHLKTTKSGINLLRNNEKPFKSQYEMPLKELQPETVALKVKGTKILNSFKKTKPNFFQNLNTKSEINFSLNNNQKNKLSENYLTDFRSLSTLESQNQYFLSSKKNIKLLYDLPELQPKPNKKTIELYMNNCSVQDKCDTDDANIIKKQFLKSNILKNKEKKEINESNISKNKNGLKRCTRSFSLQKFDKNIKQASKPTGKKLTDFDNVKKKNYRSRSCDKSVRKVSKNEVKIKSSCSSKSMLKIWEKTKDTHKNKALIRGKIGCPKKNRKPMSETSGKKLLDMDQKTRINKKKNILSKSYSFGESPYCAKTLSKTLGKLKPNRRKSVKNIETHSDKGERFCKQSKNKI